MANTLPGTPYVESSDLVANYPAVSESLAERVDLVGILPFATSTARGTALPTPTDGQYTYLQDTNSTEFWNGSAWQSAGIDPGLRIVSPTSIANSGGSASASGGQVTFTGVSSVSLNGVFTSAYDNYRVSIKFIGSANTDCFIRYRTSGTDNSTAVYQTQYVDFTGTSSLASRASNQSSSLIGIVGDVNDSNFTTIEISAPNLSARTTSISQSFGPNFGGYQRQSASYFNNTTVFDGFTFFASTGTLTGTIRVYGYKNS